ncbi:MAG: hypothetical protein M3Y27_12860, partial [Acidobacteriota bacterium]|nr:hypothetical protein [Acidobacteriota bacterium]
RLSHLRLKFGKQRDCKISFQFSTVSVSLLCHDRSLSEAARQEALSEGVMLMAGLLRTEP